jgi:hypothetical protein
MLRKVLLLMNVSALTKKLISTQWQFTETIRFLIWQFVPLRHSALCPIDKSGWWPKTIDLRFRWDNPFT